MIPAALRKRLENFICEHTDCAHDQCMLKEAEDWVEEMKARGYPSHELLLLGLAYQAYVARDQASKAKLGAYEAAISGYVAKKARTQMAPVLKMVR